jgi:hypothetical protein
VRSKEPVIAPALDSLLTKSSISRSTMSESTVPSSAMARVMIRISSSSSSCQMSRPCSSPSTSRITAARCGPFMAA